MADPQNWMDVAQASLPIVGAVAGAGVTTIGAWLLARSKNDHDLQLAQQNNGHARELARDQQAAARQQAMDDRREQQREQLLAQATAFYRNGRQVAGASGLGLMNLGQRYDRLQQGHRWSVVEPPEDMDALTTAAFEAAAALLLLAQDPALRAPVVAFEDAMHTVPPAVGEMHAALRASAESQFTTPNDQSAFENAYDEAQAGLMAATQALEDFARAARDLLGVRLVEPAAPPPGPPAHTALPPAGDPPDRPAG